MAISAPQNFFGIMILKPYDEIESSREKGKMELISEVSPRGTSQLGHISIADTNLIYRNDISALMELYLPWNSSVLLGDFLIQPYLHYSCSEMATF